MTNQNNFKPGQNHGAPAGRGANERSGEKNKGSQNDSSHRGTERDYGNAGGRSANRKAEADTQASGKSGL